MGCNDNRIHVDIVERDSGAGNQRGEVGNVGPLGGRAAADTLHLDKELGLGIQAVKHEAVAGGCGCDPFAAGDSNLYVVDEEIECIVIHIFDCETLGSSGERQLVHLPIQRGSDDIAIGERVRVGDSLVGGVTDIELLVTITVGVFFIVEAQGGTVLGTVEQRGYQGTILFTIVEREAIGAGTFRAACLHTRTTA